MAGFPAAGVGDIHPCVCSRWNGKTASAGGLGQRGPGDRSDSWSGVGGERAEGQGPRAKGRVLNGNLPGLLFLGPWPSALGPIPLDPVPLIYPLPQIDEFAAFAAEWPPGYRGVPLEGFSAIWAFRPCRLFFHWKSGKKVKGCRYSKRTGCLPASVRGDQPRRVAGILW